MLQMSISTKYRITKRDLAATLETIKKSGYYEALSLAFNGSVSFLEKDPSQPLATTYLAWSVNLLSDARGAKSDADIDKFNLLSRFYRELAHKLYWRQRADGSIEVIKDFIQLAPVGKSK